MCARRRSNFLSSRRKKVTKERATLHAASLRFAAGNLRCSCVGRAAELATRCALRSDNRSESEHEARALRRPCRPTPCAPRRIVKGTQRTSTRAIAALGPISRAAQAGPSKAMARADVRLSTPCWLRLRRGGCGVSMRVGARMPRELTRRGCPSGARSAKRVPRRTPQPPRRRFAP